ncbi:unnamed protein product [Soboliphyme baturini]|uniref:Mediator of RNA polymerase II transcription subunit 1 n=1 Tax=Soboliphyme baturini TaxID=241478 RepID=A0A183IVT6_9BILA|nr:unnamed protein product [Soboliphyme baturini]
MSFFAFSAETAYKNLKRVATDVLSAVHHLTQVFCETSCVGVSVAPLDNQPLPVSVVRDVHTVEQPIVLKIETLHNLPFAWSTT